MFVIYLYLIGAITIAVATIVRVGLWVGAAIFVASLLALTGAGGIKAALLWYPAKQRRGIVAFGLVLLVVAYWLSTKFSVAVEGRYLSGLAWTVAGMVIGALFVSRKLAV